MLLTLNLKMKESTSANSEVAQESKEGLNVSACYY